MPDNATAVVLNVTAAKMTDPGYLTVWPAAAPQTGTSNLNVRPGQALANLVICRLGEAGAVDLALVRGECEVIADLLGYFVD